MRVLVVKTSALGDVVHAFPVADYLKSNGAIVDWVAEEACAPLVERHPSVHHVYRINTRQWRKGRMLKSFVKLVKELRQIDYDIVFDLQGNIKSTIFTALARSCCRVGFGKKSVAEWPNRLATDTQYEPIGKGVQQRYLSLVAQKLKKEITDLNPVSLQLLPEEQARLEQLEPSVKKSILVCPCTRWPNKMLPEETWTAFLKKNKQPALICWGTEEEREMACRIAAEVPEVMLLDRLSLPLLQNVMALSKGVISVDSLALHLAASSGVPTLSIFTASSADEYAPLKQHSVQAPCPYGITFTRRCPNLRSCATGGCRDLITSDELLAAWKKITLV